MGKVLQTDGQRSPATETTLTKAVFRTVDITYEYKGD